MSEIPVTDESCDLCGGSKEVYPECSCYEAIAGHEPGCCFHGLSHDEVSRLAGTPHDCPECVPKEIKMPGPVSDAYDPEFGTRSRAHEIIDELDRIYGYVTNFLRKKPPIYILDLIDADLPRQVDAPPLTEKDWRLIRFAIERAKDSI